jgi:hypothetical protein
LELLDAEVGDALALTIAEQPHYVHGRRGKIHAGVPLRVRAGGHT